MVYLIRNISGKHIILSDLGIELYIGETIVVHDEEMDLPSVKNGLRSGVLSVIDQEAEYQKKEKPRAEIELNTRRLLSE